MQKLLNHLLFGAEHVVERLFRHIRALGDPVHRRTGIAVLLQDLLGSIKDSIAPFRFAQDGWTPALTPSLKRVFITQGGGRG
ncbi:hypothetical protein GCM10007207_18600 [Asaia siamensis]|uniref:Uncharacterized protein n=1 Tax=Asaia siamensis TaxID=110479 RepID=A0ABQ1M2I9_9PROT|nr:hypothetical protein AA0323_2797 [Asaia siamensis NRIC 0323]GGC33371.1 hypothetical protein GCM10007207_18600 [Asaia siamensis]